MASSNDIDEQMAGLNIEEEENEGLIFEGDVEEQANRYELCLVGRFLTEKNLNVRAMKSKMADVWKPTMGINIKELDAGIFLFQFYHKEDLQWVINGGPWSFDNAMLVLALIPNGENPVKVPLWHLSIWIQIFDLPSSFMNENVGKQLGNFFGEYLQYDDKNNAALWREFMRVKIRIDVRKPLKRKKKITRKDKSEFIITCKYERLGEFCFSCGLVSHTERFCRRFIDKRGEEGVKDWGNWLKAPPRRVAGATKSKWLREEDDDSWEVRVGRENSKAKFQGSQNSNDDNLDEGGRDNRELIIVTADSARISKQKDNSANFMGFKSNSNPLYGPEDDLIIGLQLEGNKRKRIGPASASAMDTEEGNILSGPVIVQQEMGVVISDSDLATPSNSLSAKLAKQASREP